jgi:hypothetical protein
MVDRGFSPTAARVMSLFQWQLNLLTSSPTTAFNATLVPVSTEADVQDIVNRKDFKFLFGFSLFFHNS